jgi:UDP-hydrolysing UDP-N-acetyl-D-glucosamine 2-epimerase
MRTIAAVTVGRADAGILRPVLPALADGFQVQLVAAGTHASPAGLDTLRDIAADGVMPAALVSTVPEGDDPGAIARAMGAAVIGFTDAFARLKPDLVLVIGDRFETAAAALACVPFGIALCHVHGGELSEGAIDERLRHAITKLSHLHFVAGDRQAARVIQMGEEPWRVIVSGAPALDQLKSIRLLPRGELETRLGRRFDAAPLLVTYHPETIEFAAAERHVVELTAALDGFDGQVVVTAPNVDTSHRTVRQHLQAWVSERPSAVYVEALGTQVYWSLMAIAGAVVGNSSSGIIEAASFKLPVVDIGQRQAGRDRPANVIHAGNDRREITRALACALDPGFRRSLVDLVNPYGDGAAAARIAQTLRDVPLDATLLTKRFHHLQSGVERA